ncbi:carbohydrate kinase [Crocosphaera sp. UHCC 0190]|uniref:carbohydrate kinase family protein n=1 Tax=Crocosphaera sp. UHCC 0190 TaxID=3110246 RepID=UPI002B1EAA58|nr:carbohydrate kinase [Crocosphaera sp. UHCC 0190]MEA5509580.1 carbohydrate kinase [Crocosphaera sp. UHCC 0190]
MISDPQILCLGEILFDCLADQLGKELVDVTSWTAYAGGAPANVACALTKLGTQAAFIGCLGQDKPGNELVSLLEKTEINITGIQRHSTAPTRKVYVTRSLKGERNFAGFGQIETHKFADTQLLAKNLPESIFINAKYLVIGTLLLAYPNSKQALEKALELAKKHRVSIFVDINWRPMFWEDLEAAQPLIMSLLHQSDFLKCSQEEAQWLLNTETPQKIAQYFPNLQGILVTAGEKGCNYYLGKNQGQIDTFPVKVIDTTGAGDSFVAGFLHQSCLKGDLLLSDPKIAREAIIYASAVGALTTTQPGAIAAQPTGEEVSLFLTQNQQG